MNTPKIFFESGWLIDLGWDFNNPDETIADAALPYVKKLFGPFESVWLENGVRLLEATSDLLAKEWKRRELTCTLVVHPEQSSNSHPLILNVRKYYKMEEFTPELKRQFIDTLYHELLHRMLDDYWQNNLEVGEFPLPALESYKDEDIFVLAHLHLYAVQEAVFRKLKMDVEWEEMKTWVGHKSYQRALQIVAEEGYQYFVEDLMS